MIDYIPLLAVCEPWESMHLGYGEIQQGGLQTIGTFTRDKNIYWFYRRMVDMVASAKISQREYMYKH